MVEVHVGSGIGVSVAVSLSDLRVSRLSSSVVVFGSVATVEDCGYSHCPNTAIAVIAATITPARAILSDAFKTISPCCDDLGLFLGERLQLLGRNR